MACLLRRSPCVVRWPVRRQPCGACSSVTEMPDSREQASSPRHSPPRRSTSASRIEPPGWTNARDARRRCRPRRRRGTGRTRPTRRPRPDDAPRRDRAGLRRPPGGRRRPGSSGRIPSPTSAPSRTRTIAFDVTPRTRRQARSRSTPLGVGRARGVVHDLPGRRVVGRGVRRGDEDGAAGRPDRADRVRAAGAAARRGRGRSSTRTRRFGFVGQDLEGRGVERRRHDDLEEDATPAPSAVARRPRGSARRPRRTPRPGRPRAPPPRPRAASARSAAPHGFVCLTITHGRAAQRPADRRRGRRVEDVVVGQRLALERRRAPVANGPSSARRAGPAVARRGLVRVLAVAQRLDLLERRS